MANKFPTKAPVYTTEKLSKTRVAVYEDGVYCCQLQPKEVASWLFKAERSAKNFVENETYFLVNRIIGALEYLEARSKRVSNIEAKSQMELF